MVYILLYKPRRRYVPTASPEVETLANADSNS